MVGNERRWPARVYRHGSEPDPRFTLANERTFLAWIRTSLALVVAGLAVEVFLDTNLGVVRSAVAAFLVGLGVVTSASAFGRWMVAERALRENRALPGPSAATLMGYGIAIGGVLLLVSVRPFR